MDDPWDWDREVEMLETELEEARRQVADLEAALIVAKLAAEGLGGSFN